MTTNTALTGTVLTDCSDCRVDLKINLDHMIIFATRPSNGVRGRGHEPARLVSESVTEDDGLLMWDCPVCGHADSYYDMEAAGF